MFSRELLFFHTTLFTMASGIPWSNIIKESGSSIAPGPPAPRQPNNVKQRTTVPKKLALKLKNGFEKTPDSTSIDAQSSPRMNGVGRGMR